MKTFLKDCRWGKFLLIEGDLISGYVNALGHWCDIEVDLFRMLLPTETGTCIEVGSNIGMHAVPLAKLCSRGELICYEPQRPIFHVLCANLALNNCLNVTTRRAAVGEKNGRIEIETDDYDQPWNYGSFSVSTGFSNEGQFSGPVKTEMVDIVALDRDPALEKLTALHLLKIDAEGHELSVIAGAKKLIARHKPNVFVEPGGKQNIDRLRDAMRKLGYQGYWLTLIRGFRSWCDLAPSHRCEAANPAAQTVCAQTVRANAASALPSGNRRARTDQSVSSNAEPAMA